MASISISPSCILASREIRFLNRQETRFPHLMRLSMDFNFRVLEVLNQTRHPLKQYVLVTEDYRSDGDSITPAFTSMQTLNQYVGDNMVDILHDYLFGFTDEDPQQTPRFA